MLRIFVLHVELVGIRSRTYLKLILSVDTFRYLTKQLPVPAYFTDIIQNKFNYYVGKILVENLHRVTNFYVCNKLGDSFSYQMSSHEFGNKIKFSPFPSLRNLVTSVRILYFRVFKKNLLFYSKQKNSRFFIVKYKWPSRALLWGNC